MSGHLQYIEHFQFAGRVLQLCREANVENYDKETILIDDLKPAMQKIGGTALIGHYNNLVANRKMLLAVRSAANQAAREKRSRTPAADVRIRPGTSPAFALADRQDRQGCRSCEALRTRFIKRRIDLGKSRKG